MTVICPRCSRWMSFARDDARHFTPRYELPCQHCGVVFRIGDTVKDADYRYFWFYVSIFPPSHGVWAA